MNQSDLKKLELRLLKKEKALDERESTAADVRKKLIEREEALKGLEIESKTLEGLIANKTNNLRGLEEQLEIINDALETRTTQQDSFEFESKKKKSQLEDTLGSLKKEINAHFDEIRRQKDTIEDLKTETQQRKDYLEDQERIVTEVVDKANERVLDLRDTIGDLEDQEKTLRLEMTQERKDYENSIFNLQEMEAQQENEVENLGLRLDSLLEEVKEKEKLLQEATEAYEATREETSRLQTMLKEKETSVLVKIDMQRQEKAALDLEKRRWQSTKLLYED